MIFQAVDIDSAVYPEEFQGVYKTCLKWLFKNPDIYIIIEDAKTKEVVGYINVMPLTQEYYQKIRSGEIIDTDIPVEYIESYETPGTYQLYFSSIVIRPDYQNGTVFRFLMKSFFSHLETLQKQGIEFSTIVADAVSDRGEKLCKYMGLECVLETEHGTRIYESNVSEIRVVK